MNDGLRKYLERYRKAKASGMSHAAAVAASRTTKAPARARSASPRKTPAVISRARKTARATVAKRMSALGY